MLQIQKLDVSTHPSFDNHEDVVSFKDSVTGLNAIIAVHNTNLGPALGGCRFFPYADDAAAITDVLRLSRGMTYKSALAKLPLGGGKAVIIGDPRQDKTEAMMESFGAAIESLQGQYISAEDVGTNEHDMIAINRKTSHVTGLPALAAGEEGVSGNPSPVTAYGCFFGIKACAKEKFGTADLTGKTVAIQGMGAVGYALAQYLVAVGANLIVADVHQTALDKAQQEFGDKVRILDASMILSADADILAPCAMGAVLNDRTIPTIRAQIIAGAANNQLAEKRHDAMLKEKGILYAPDYAINSGGVTSVGYEYYWRRGKDMGGKSFTTTAMTSHVEKIEETLLSVFAIARGKGLPTGEAADQLAEDIFKTGALESASRTY